VYAIRQQQQTEKLRNLLTNVYTEIEIKSSLLKAFLKKVKRKFAQGLMKFLRDVAKFSQGLDFFIRKRCHIPQHKSFFPAKHIKKMRKTPPIASKH